MKNSFSPLSFARTIVLCIVLIAFSVNLVNAQNPGDPANFDVHGNVYSGTPTTNVDDWFQGTTGFGLIDETNTALYTSYITPTLSNTPFLEGPSFNQYEIQNGVILYDAIFGRDYLNLNSSGLGGDATAFSGGSSKNGKDPTVDWINNTVNVLSKNDLVDVYAHVRRNGTDVTSDMWIDLGLSTYGLGGARFIDFELYQNEIAVSGTSFTNSGTDEGHSAWVFDASGNIVSTGDMIIGFELNGSSVLAVELRVWVSRNDYNNLTPAAFAWGASFDGSGNGSTYGYAQVVLSATDFFTSGNITTTGPPWGTLEVSTTGNYTPDYIAGALAEVAVNLTAIGIDPSLISGGNACDAPFTRVLVKSRTSASFTSALKDFAGPYAFLEAPVIDAAIDDPGLFTCTNTTLTLSPTNPVTGAYYEWTTTDGLFTNGTQTFIGQDAGITQPGTYTLNASPLAGCDVNSNSIIIHATPCAIDDFMGSMVENVGNITYNVLTNGDGTTDTDLENDIDISSINNAGLLQPSNGNISINTTTGEITYTPNADFFGADAFEYQICDLNSPALCDIALVTVRVLRDYDDDAIADVDDLDDDNDGILDTVECLEAGATSSGIIGSIIPTGWDITSPSGNSGPVLFNSFTFNSVVISEYRVPVEYNENFVKTTGSFGISDITRRTYGVEDLDYTTATDWNTEILPVFQSNDMNLYQDLQVDVVNNVSYYELRFDTPIVSKDLIYVLVFEKSGNNELSIQALDYQKNALGTAVNVDVSDYEDTGSDIIAGGVENLEIATYPIDNLAPVGSEIHWIRVYDRYNGPDAADGKVFIMAAPDVPFSCKDTDGDLIPDYLDTDSDEDGCPDAIEGAGTYATSDLTTSNNFADTDEGQVDANGVPEDASANSLQQATTSAVTDDLDVLACSADLSLTKTIDDATPKPGQTITYTLILINSGPSETTGVQVEDILPEGLIYDIGNSTIPAGTTYDNVTGIWDLSTLTINNGDSFTLEIAATVSPACGEIINTAEIISSNKPDSDSTINNGN